MKNKLGGRIMKGFAVLRPKMNCYVTDDVYVDEKERAQRRV